LKTKKRERVRIVEELEQRENHEGEARNTFVSGGKKRTSYYSKVPRQCPLVLLIRRYNESEDVRVVSRKSLR
jgi:hypothetical protein